MNNTESAPMFEVFKPMIEMTDGLTLSQVCSITGLEPSTIQNWVKRGFVAHPVNKKYYERQLARILLISSLRECMKIDNIGELMTMINGSADDESDDIISEQELYDYFCEIILAASDYSQPIGEIPKLVDKTMIKYNAPSESANKRLREALSVMVYAYTASEYKKRADGIFEKMREEMK